MSEQLILPGIIPNNVMIYASDRSHRGLGEPYMQVTIGNQLIGYSDITHHELLGKTVIIREVSEYKILLELAD